jgi:hypothetical protein
MLARWGCRSPEQFRDIARGYEHFCRGKQSLSERIRAAEDAVSALEDKLAFAQGSAKQYTFELGLDKNDPKRDAAVLLSKLSELERMVKKCEKAEAECPHPAPQKALDSLPEQAEEQAFFDLTADKTASAADPVPDSAAVNPGNQHTFIIMDISGKQPSEKTCTERPVYLFRKSVQHLQNHTAPDPCQKKVFSLPVTGRFHSILHGDLSPVISCPYCQNACIQYFHFIAVLQVLYNIIRSVSIHKI